MEITFSWLRRSANSVNQINLSKVGLAMATFGVVILVFTESLFGSGAIAIVLQVGATLLMIWARYTFGRRSFHAGANPTEGGLVNKGPYKYIRHPIYAAVLYFLWAGVLTHLDVLSGSMGLLVSVGLVMRMLAEERLVAERYPEYAAYATHTKRILPFIL